MTLRVRVVLAMALLSTALTAAVGILTYRSTSDRLADEVDLAIDEIAAVVLAPVPRGAPPPGAPPPPEGAPPPDDVSRPPGAPLPPFLSQIDDFSVDRFDFRLIGPDGAVVASTLLTDAVVPFDSGGLAGLRQGETVMRTTVRGEDGERFRTCLVNSQFGPVEIIRSLEGNDRVLSDLRWRTAFLVAVAALLASVIGWVLATRISRPLAQLASTAEQIGATGRLDLSLPDVDRRDEVGVLGREFAGMVESLARSRNEQERLVQDAGHELRTPLTSLTTNLEVMRRHEDLDPTMRRTILDDLEGEVHELTELVNELVAAAAGEAGDDAPESIDLAEVIRSIAGRISRRADRPIEVEVEPDAVGLRVTAVESRLQRSVSNLIENARKFDSSDAPILVRVGSMKVVGTADSSAKPRARRSARLEQWVSVRVLDEGPGIPEVDLAHVFDRFHRSDAARKLPGSGLGLAIVGQVVTAAGGRLVAENRAGGGACVGFELPADPADTRQVRPSFFGGVLDRL